MADTHVILAAVFLFWSMGMCLLQRLTLCVYGKAKFITGGYINIYLRDAQEQRAWK